MPKLLFPLFIVFVVASCKNKKREINPVFPSISVKTVSIIDDIVKDGDVDAGVTGIAGVKSDQYKRYEWMKSKLSDSFLYKLTDHQNPAVRVYAFFALAERRSPLLNKIAVDHKNDTAIFMSRSGCDGMQDRVNRCFQRIVNGKNWFPSYDDFITKKE